MMRERPRHKSLAIGSPPTELSNRPRSGGAVRATSVVRHAHLSIFIFLFLVGLMIPIQLYAGTLRLSPYRIVLIVSIIPCLFLWLGGRAGRIRAADVLVILFAFWAGLSFVLAHELTSAIQTTGILFIETVGAYFVARCFIRNKHAFVSMVRFLFYGVLFLLPFAVYESITSRPLLLGLIGSFASVFPDVHIEPRWGLHRAQVVFEHPILYGVFCASVFAPAYYVLGQNSSKLSTLLRPGLIAVATFFSMSTGALVAIAVQAGLISWDLATRSLPHRWIVLGVFAMFAYVAVDLYSNRTPVEVFIEYLTFSHHNSYNRVLIWQYGTAEVMRHPLFGIGYNEWERVWWMSSSMDNFWLVLAVRHGLPGLFLLASAITLVCVGLGRLKTTDPDVKACQKGLLIAIGGLVVAAGTVHYWNAVYCLLMFLVGSGVWMLDQDSRKTLRAFP